jgi:hypothetical protein
MPIQSALALVGVAKQTNKATRVANPQFGHGVTDGTILTVEVQQELEGRTSGTRFSPAVNRTAVMPGFDFTGRVHAASAGLWLFGALGAISTTGTTTKTHAITLGADLPYLTVTGRLDSNIYSVDAAKVDTCELSWSENEPVEMAVSGMGCGVTIPATFTAVTDDSFAAYMRPAGGSFQLDIDGTTLAAEKMTGGSVSIANALAPVMLSGALNPDDVFPGQQTVECSFDITPDDMDEWRTVLTGSAAGTTIASAPVYGSFSTQFTDGTNTLTLAANRVAFTTDFPAADAAGGPVSISLAGLVVLGATGGTAFTATLTNTVAAY